MSARVDRPAVGPSSARATHRLVLGSTRWSLWREAALRGAGFSIDHVEPFGDDALVRAADAWFALEASARAVALETLRREHECGERAPWRKRLLAALARGDAPAFASRVVDALHRAGRSEIVVDAADARARVAELFRETEAREIHELRRIAAEPRFQEAVAWQSRTARHGAVAAVAAGSTKPAHLACVAGYLQRYAVKNDTIGEFGPVGWARFSEEPSCVTVHPGSALVDHRASFLETWAVDAIAAIADREPRARRYAAPRRSPFVSISDQGIILPTGMTLPLAADQVAVLRACLGSASAIAIAEDAAREPSPSFPTAVAVLDFLELATQLGVVKWSYEPAQGLDAERRLRASLERIEDPSLRATLLEPLAVVRATLDEVDRAAGRTDARIRALDDLDAKFTEVTGLDAWRNAGETYAARRIAYEECRRGARAEIGGEALAAFAPALAIVLDVARAHLGEVTERVERAVATIFARLAGDRDEIPVALLAHALFTDPEGIRGVGEASERARSALETKLELLFPTKDGGADCDLSSRDLADAVGSTFGRADSPWPAARFLSPDLFIVPNDGAPWAVLGELHFGLTMRAAPFVAMHPDPSALRSALSEDLPERTPSIVPPKRMYPQRTGYELHGPREILIPLSDEPVPIFSGGSTLPGDLRVVRGDSGLVVRQPNGETFPLRDLLGALLQMKASETFSLRPRGDAAPRVTIDRLVVSRRSWRFPASDAAFAQAATSLDRLVGARRFCAGRRIARYCFMRSPLERKPVYVDFASPTFVDRAAKLIRAAGELPTGGTITLSEMLPLHRDCWLHDHEGRRYTCELRAVAHSR